MDISLFLMGICHPQRLNWLNQNIDHLEQQKFDFKEKLIFIDEFNGWTFPKNLYYKFTDLNYTVIVDSHKSRIKTMDKAFDTITSEYIFYNEDDVLSNLPNIKDINNIFSTKIDNKTCGMLSLTLGGCSNILQNEYGDLYFATENIIYNTETWFAFKRLEEYKNSWFFEFPGLFIPTKLFEETHKIAKSKFPNSQVEQGLTKAYFSLGKDKDFYKCSIAKNNLNEVLNSSNPHNLIADSRLLTNLDEQQGRSIHGGSHTY